MSQTIVGLLIIILGWLGLGDLVTQSEIGSFVDIAIQAAGIGYVWYKRYKAGGINIVGLRK